KDIQQETSKTPLETTTFHSMTPEDLYQEILNAKTATEAWIAANDFKEAYPQNEKLTKGFKAASQRIYDMAKASQRSGNTKVANKYYSWLAEEELVPETIRLAAETYLNESESSQNSSEEMYQEVLNARTATEAWVAAKEF